MADLGDLWVHTPDFSLADFTALQTGIHGSSESAAPRAHLQRFKASNPGSGDRIALTPGTNAQSNSWLLEDGDISNAPGSLALLFPENGSHVVKRCKFHNGGGGTTYATHGLYDKSPGTLVEDCEGYAITRGQVFSIRYPNTYARCVTHDTGNGVGVFNYAPVNAGTVVIREHRAWKLTSWFLYHAPEWNDTHTGAYRGVSKFGLELDHATLDLRVAGPGALAFQDFSVPIYLTNSIVITDDPGVLLKPKNGAAVHLDGTVFITSLEVPKWFASTAPDFVLAPGSPAIGAAVASPPETLKRGYPNLPDLGAVQSVAAPPPPPPPVVDWKALILEALGELAKAQAALTKALG